MAHIAPFKALRPKKDIAHQVAAPPYDVASRDEARAAATDDKHFYHITRSEIDLSDDVDVHSDVVYQKALENLRKFVADGVLFLEDKPCYYLYELIMNGRSQTGLLCLSSIDDYRNGIIKKHELTRPDKEQDRIDHIVTTKVQTGVVFLAYRDVWQLQDLYKDWKANHKPEYDFVANDGISHKIWIIDDQDTINQITAFYQDEVPHTYIADGHHRAASAEKVARELGDQLPNANYFLTCIFPESEVKILEYNRIVKDFNGLTPQQFLKKIQLKFDLKNIGNQPFTPTTPLFLGMYMDHDWYELYAKPGTYNEHDTIEVLDVQILQNNILSEILGIDDPRTNDRVAFVGGIRGLKALVDLVDSGEAVAAFTCHPVSMKQLLEVADSGKVMPPKSTWFEPKTRDGLASHVIDTNVLQ